MIRAIRTSIRASIRANCLIANARYGRYMPARAHTYQSRAHTAHLSAMCPRVRVWHVYMYHVYQISNFKDLTRIEPRIEPCIARIEKSNALGAHQ